MGRSSTSSAAIALVIATVAHWRLNLTRVALHVGVSRLPVRLSAAYCQNVHYVALSVELVGALVTAYGLMYAYGRNRHLPDRMRAWWRRMLESVRDGAVKHGLRFPLEESRRSFDPDLEFQLNEDASIESQLRQLAEYMRLMDAMFLDIYNNIHRLDRAIKNSNAHAETVAGQALTDAKAEIARFGDHLDELQATDLRIAVVGVLITATGIALGFVGG